MKAAILILLSVITTNFNPVSSSGTLRIELLRGQRKCIGQDFDEGDEAVFRISAFNDIMEGSVSVKISDPDDSILVDEKIVVEDSKKVKQIPLTITSHGVHEMCLKLRGDTPVTVNFGIDIKSNRARLGEDPSKRVGKDSIPSLETELLAAEESLNDISKEIEYARKQEILLTKATEATGSRVQWFSIFSMMILLITSLWQIIYLRHFFTSKKLL